jgi:8-oxo-dGTP pyrophosphatase MutT (NUDIX family)
MKSVLGPEEIARRLGTSPRKTIGHRGDPAAVLIALFERNGETSLLLTRRARHLRKHGGQYAFPGGRRDPGDDSTVATALREAHEEVGIVSSDVRVLGALDDYTTSSGFIVTPVVGWIAHPYVYRTNPQEVEYIAELPLQSFLQPQPARTLWFEGFRRIVMAFDVEGHFIWGATASMLRELVRRLREP